MKKAIALNFGMSGLGKEGKCQWPCRAIGMFYFMPWHPRGRGSIHYTSSLLGTSTESVQSTSKRTRGRRSIQSNVPYEFLLGCIGDYTWRWAWHLAVMLSVIYRLFELSVSNCLNCNVLRTSVLTQFNSASLKCHLSHAYSSNMGGYGNVLSIVETPEKPNWFQGIADAMRQCMQMGFLVLVVGPTISNGLHEVHAGTQ